jgi:transposase
MDALLFIGTKEEKRTLMCFFFFVGVPGAEIRRRISVQYGNSVMLEQIVYKWVKRLKNGCTSIKHEEGARRLSTFITDANMEQVCDMILQNRQVTTDEVAHQLQISHGSAYEISHNRLAFHKVCMMSRKATHRIAPRQTFGHLQTTFGLLWC